MNTRPSPTPATSGPLKKSSSPVSTPHASSSTQQQASMASGSRVSRGSTPTTSRSSVKTVDGDKPGRPSSKDSLKREIPKKADGVTKLSKSEEQLKALMTDFNSLRTLVTCKICDRLLYEPYTIACGHTYCYSCLCTWFVNNKARKTCPDCRTLVTELPAPAYVIREMTLIFINRAELLPAGETVEEHNKLQKEEADIVQQDKNNPDLRLGGLFRGCFRPRLNHRPNHLRPMRDDEDGVDRCPMCHYELEDGECGQCGLFFDDNGAYNFPGDGFSGFSDMDETSEHDMSGEDLDGEIDMDDAGFSLGYGEGLEDYLDDDELSITMRRFLEHGGIPQHFHAPRRRMTHSEAGSRRSYSQSVSDMYTEEMDTVEEEDEEDLDEDSSMNDFIDDPVSESATSTASSTPGQTPQPQSSASRYQGRARRIVPSEGSSTPSHATEEDEDEPPLPNGRQRRLQALARANGSQRPASTASEASAEAELDEETMGILRDAGWSPLAHDGPDDGTEEEMDEDGDSDGGRTTVGWDATAISNDRHRIGGSLTPTADRPRPNAPIRPPSRIGLSRRPDGSRGLRRRSSVLSTSTVNYEDGEADDDDSDIDQDGDFNMAMHALHARRSQIRMRNNFVNPPPAQFARPGLSLNNPIDLDTDDNSDSTQQPSRNRGTNRARQQEYNPRISWMFASHLADLRETERGGATFDLLEQLRSTTPVARPRTANRNRPSAQASPAAPFSPFAPPTRLRTPTMENVITQGIAARGMSSPTTRSSLNSSYTTPSSGEESGRVDRVTSIGSVGNSPTTIPPTSGIRHAAQQSANAISQAQNAAAADIINRPQSRVGSRPSSAAGRRNSSGISPVLPGLSHPGVGLNMNARVFHGQAQAGNPWAAFVQSQGVMRRASRHALREQPSTATIRPMNSRAHMRSQPSQVNIRDALNSPPQNMRHQSSRRRLNNQSSTRTLRQGDHARPPPPPSAVTDVTASPIARVNRSPLTAEERQNLGRELALNRARELGLGASSREPGFGTSNPFAGAVRRPSVPNRESPPTSSEAGSLRSTATSSSAHTRNGSNESIASVIAAAAPVQNQPPQSPGLNRRRSSRNMGGPPPVIYNPPHPQPTFTTATNLFHNGYPRSRTGSFASNSAYESPLNANTRGISPMVAAGDRGQY